jgi:hypothetical protein
MKNNKTKEYKSKTVAELEAEFEAWLENSLI